MKHYPFMFPFFFLQPAVFINWSRVVAASIYGSQLFALFVERGDPRLTGIPQRRDAIHTRLLQHNKIWISGEPTVGSLAGNVVSVGRRGCGADRLPFTRRQQKNTPRELRAADKVTGIRLDQFLRGRLPGSPLAFAGQTSIQPARKPGSPTRLRAVSELRGADKILSRRAILVASRTFTAWMRPTERFKGASASFLPTTLLPPSLACIVTHPPFAPWMWHKPPHLDTRPTRVHVKGRWGGWAGSSCSSLWIISV